MQIFDAFAGWVMLSDLSIVEGLRDAKGGEERAGAQRSTAANPP
jgi:hypothetical protein